jgi:FlaA1/EpsC-like NDP-sugar epimerase
MTMSKTSLPQLNGFLLHIRNEIKRKEQIFYIYYMGVDDLMKAFIAAFLSFKEVSSYRGIERYIYQHGISIVPCVIVLIIGLIIGFNAAALFSSMRIMPVDIIVCGSLVLFLLITRSKIALPMASTNNPHEIKVTDLLEREVVPLGTSEAFAFLKGQVILVTGAAGSIGLELCRQLLDYEPELLIALDMNETGLFDLAEGLRSHPNIANLNPHIGDITDVQRMTRLFAEKRPNIVFHAAAYKHVPLLEQYPDLAIRTNVLGTYHLCRLAQKYDVACFVFISTDKAVQPISIMGASKRLGEMIVQSLAASTNCMTRFCAVRFGNVLGSRGSVVPIFAQQIEQGGPLTVTDPKATRYFMTIPEACELVILTSAIAGQGGLYLLNMGDPVQIIDLAVKMIRLCGLRVGRDISIVYTGLRPGERLHETLVAADEELIPTTNTNIFCVTHKSNLPTLAMIDKWVDTIEDCLAYQHDTQFRKHLFEIVCEQELITNI